MYTGNENMERHQHRLTRVQAEQPTNRMLCVCEWGFKEANHCRRYRSPHSLSRQWRSESFVVSYIVIVTVYPCNTQCETCDTQSCGKIIMITQSNVCICLSWRVIYMCSPPAVCAVRKRCLIKACEDWSAMKLSKILLEYILNGLERYIVFSIAYGVFKQFAISVAIVSA